MREKMETIKAKRVPTGTSCGRERIKMWWLGGEVVRRNNQSENVWWET
jgi:hypothetical protein